MDLAPYAAFAEELAERAGAIARKYFRQKLTVETKADESPVTIADREIETALRAMIETRYPEHGVYGEEHGRDRVDAQRVWVIDPIDGTKSFISGVPLFGALIALLDEGRPVLGVLDLPGLGERFVGMAGAPTLWNGRACRTRQAEGLAQASLFATSPEMFQGSDRADFQRLEGRVRMRRFGGDCYAYAMLAAGFVDLVVEAQLQPYDFMALVPIIEGAGGKITGWDDRPLTVRSDGHVLAAATAALHADALAVLNG